MRVLNHVYICGLGALGSMYASRLVSCGDATVRAVVDDARLARYRSQGIYVNGAKVPIGFLTPRQDAPEADLVLICVKWHQLGDAIAAVRPFVGRDTIILSLLNGIRSEDVIGKVLGPEKLLYSFAIETDAVRTESGTSYGDVGVIVFGEASNVTPAPNVEAVEDLLERADIRYRVPQDMLREMWWKFMMNVGVNQTSAILRAPYGIFQKIDAARETVRIACREVIQIAEHVGVNLAETDIEAALAVIDRLSPDKKTSMLQDVEAHRKTEVEIFAGEVVQLGQTHAIATPTNSIMLKMIETIENTYNI